MEDMEKKEELETVVGEIEETVEEEFSETEEMQEFVEETPVKQEKGSSNILGIIAGLVLFVAFLAVVWMAPVGGKTVKDTGVLYAKDNDLYYYDMKNEPYLLQEGISNGGGYNYFYNAWGAGVSQDNEKVFYTADVQTDGTYKLYFKDLKSDEEPASVIPGRAEDHIVSANGNKVALIQGTRLWISDGKFSTFVSDEMKLEEDAYALSSNGEYLVYRDAYDILYAAETKMEGRPEPVALTDDCPLYALAEDTLYFVAKANDYYNIYSYDFENEPVLVAENAQYMELMPNGKDLLYGVKPTEVIPYSELLEDDMAEIDAKMTEDDPNYEQKLMRDSLREAMKSGEGLEPMMQEYYILSNGKATLVADNVVSAIAVQDSDKNFVTGYQAKEFQPLYLSVIGGGLEMVDMIYYMSINYGGMQPFLADGLGNVEVLDGSAVLLNTVQVSQDGKKAAYLVEDADGGNVLMQMEFGSSVEATVVQKNVEEFAFVGGDELFYYYDYANGAGKLAKAGEGDNSITDASGVQFAKDMGRVYYLLLDQNTGNGKMEWWDGENRETIDGGVFAFQYKGNGKAALIYDYDIVNLIGDLGYYDGKGVTMLDEDVTAIFIN